MAFECPRCGTISHNISDEQHGYCGRCHDWTGGSKPDHADLIWQRYLEKLSAGLSRDPPVTGAFGGDPDHPPPGYWMHETSGVLRPAVEAYLEHREMTPEQIAAMRAYLRQWIASPLWRGADIDFLRLGIDGLTTRDAIDDWLSLALDAGIDPL